MRLPFKRPESDPVLSSETPPKRSRKSAPAAPAAPDATVEAARIRARRRLVGAVVLLAIGIVAFPMLFESRPRPLALDTPIEIAQREPLRSPAAAGKPVPVRPAGAEPAETILESTSRPPATASAAAVVAAPAPEVVEARPAPATSSTPIAPTQRVSEAPTKAAPAPAPAQKPAAAPPPAPKVARADDGARARALLEGSPVAAATPAAPTGDRFVVQVGAYSEANALRDARSRVERLGLKTYTQVIAKDGGRQTRVRIGPFTSRAEADAAAAKLKRGGLPASVLTL